MKRGNSMNKDDREQAIERNKDFSKEAGEAIGIMHELKYLYSKQEALYFIIKMLKTAKKDSKKRTKKTVTKIDETIINKPLDEVKKIIDEADETTIKNGIDNINKIKKETASSISSVEKKPNQFSEFQFKWTIEDPPSAAVTILPVLTKDLNGIVAKYPQVRIASQKFQSLKEQNPSLKQNELMLSPLIIPEDLDVLGAYDMMVSILSRKYIQHNIIGNYLYLKIDITRNKSNLIKELDKIIKHTQLIANIKEPKNKPSTINIWEIYDEYQKTAGTSNEKTLYKIAIEQLAKSGIVKSKLTTELGPRKTMRDTEYDAELDIMRKRVKRAYQSACNKIKQVGLEAEERAKLYKVNNSPITFL